MKRHYSLIFFMIPAVLMAQSFTFPVFNKPVRKMQELLPPKWSIKDSVCGDLNKDGRLDRTLVLEYADSVKEIRADSMENTARPRILLVLLQDSVTGDFHPVCQNNTFITRSGEGGMVDDAYGGIGIEKGVLKVSIEFVRSSAEYKFRWQQGDMYLIGATAGGADGATGDTEYWEFNFSTHKAQHTTHKHNQKEQVEWRVIKLDRPVKLRDLRQMDTLEIFPDVSI